MKTKLPKPQNWELTYVIINCLDWRVIPLENLIAKAHGGKSKLIAEVTTAEDAKVVLEALRIRNRWRFTQNFKSR